jgi:type I restriction enzyme S subunit
MIIIQQIAKTIYDYWFTQFDFPNEDGKPYRSSGGQMVWNEQLKREIPVGWSSASIVINPLSTVMKPGVDVFDRKEYLATAEVNGTSISTGSVVEYATRESRANMQPTVNSFWFAKMKNSVKHLYLNTEINH